MTYLKTVSLFYFNLNFCLVNFKSYGCGFVQSWQIQPSASNLQTLQSYPRHTNHLVLLNDRRQN